MDAGVGAAGGNGATQFGCNASGERVEGLNRFIEALLNTAVLGLPLPATKKRPRVLEADGNPLRRIGFRSRSGVVNRALIRRVQTNSMMAISALSPRRRMVRVIRV